MTSAAPQSPERRASDIAATERARAGRRRDVRPVTMPLVDRVASAVVTAVPPIMVVIGMWLGWMGNLLQWQDLLILALSYMVIGHGHHGRLSPAADPPQLQVPPGRARGLRRARLRRGRGPGDRLGRHAPQAPPVLRRRRRSAQPARGPRHGLARRACRGWCTRTWAGCSATWRWPTSGATPRTCSPTR